MEICGRAGFLLAGVVLVTSVFTFNDLGLPTMVPKWQEEVRASCNELPAQRSGNRNYEVFETTGVEKFLILPDRIRYF